MGHSRLFTGWSRAESISSLLVISINTIVFKITSNLDLRQRAIAFSKRHLNIAQYVEGLAERMLAAIVQSAFQTGCLSVESEGLIRQILAVGSCKPADLDALDKLYTAVQAGQIQREARPSVQMPQMPSVGNGAGRLTISR